MLYSVPYRRTDGSLDSYFLFTNRQPPEGASPVLIPNKEPKHEPADLSKAA